MKPNLPSHLKFTLTVVVLVLAVSAGCLIPNSAYAAPGDLFVSANVGGTYIPNGRSSIFQYTPAGSSPAIFASPVHAPRGLAFDSKGNLFVVTNIADDAGLVQGQILKIDPLGAVSPFFPTVPSACPPATPAAPPTCFPYNVFFGHLAIDSNDNVFVGGVDNGGSSATALYKVKPDGTIDSTFPSLSGTGVLFDRAGNLFTIENDGTISKLTYNPSSGTWTMTLFAGPEAFANYPGEGPSDLAFDASGNLFVSTENANGNGTPGTSVIVKLTSDYNPSLGTGSVSTVATGLSRPRGLAFDSNGNLFVAETVPEWPGDILKLTPGGTGTIVEPSPAQPAPCNPNFLVSPRTIAGNGWGVAYFDQGAVTCDFVDPDSGATFNRGPYNLTVAPGSNTTTPTGSNVTTNAGTVGFATIALTFPQVTSAGTTTVAPIDPSSAGTLPSGYQLTGSNLAFQITTTATYTAPIIIAFQVPSSLDVTTLRVLHNEGGTLVDRTATNPAPNPTTHTIYASVSSLSPFVIAKDTVTFDSLIALTRRSVTNSRVMYDLVAALTIAKNADARGFPKIEDIALKVYIKLVSLVSGKFITPQNAAILISEARTL